MSDNLSRAEMEARIGRAQAEADTKIARMEGKLDLVLAKVTDLRDDNRGIRTNMWVIAVGLAALILAAGFGIPTVFGNGMQLRDAVHSEVVETIQGAQHSHAPPRQP